MTPYQRWRRSLTSTVKNDQSFVESLVMAVFIMVPALAPGIGQIILAIAHWRAIFGFMLAVAAVSLVWFALRQPETLAPERRVRFSLGRILLAVRETCTSRVAFGYTLGSGLIPDAGDNLQYSS